MHIHQRFGEIHQCKFLQQIGWQRIRNSRFDGLYQWENDFLKGFRIQKIGLHFFRSIVKWLKSHLLGRGHLREQFNLWMNNVEPTIKRIRFSENNIVGAWFYFFEDEFYSFEPHQFDGRFSVGKNGAQPLLMTFAHFFKANDLSFYLDKRHIL